MNSNLPEFIGILMVLCLLFILFCYYRASGNSWRLITAISLIASIQGMLGLDDFYIQFDTHPLRFPMLILPSLITILILFALPITRSYLDTFDPGWLTFSHVVRFPIELILFWLYLYDQVPELMTFEGRNFDIISGLSAPFIAYWAYVRKVMDRKLILGWNVVCLFLLVNIVANAILSAPSPIQQFAFEQPNVGVFYFPFVWLPSIIVPLVLLSHIISIRLLYKKN